MSRQELIGIIMSAIQRVTKQNDMTHNPLRKAMLLLVVAIILMFLVAAGIDTASLKITEIISRSYLSADHHYLVIAGLFSVWLFTIGMMCRTLKKIPGVRSVHHN